MSRSMTNPLARLSDSTPSRLARVLGPTLLVLLSGILSGCGDNPYCFNCGSPNDGSAGSGSLDGSGTAGDGSDLNLDGSAGSGSDLELDPEGCGLLSTVTNCGECGNSCERIGAIASCERGDDGYECAYACAPGRYDLDGDLYDAESNGCEYTCAITNGGTELCDGLDNDCNGETDESTDTSDDPSNCGACGNVCYFANAGAACEDGRCVATGCRSGFIDLNGDLVDEESDGCEYGCRPTDPDDEICDGLDNDCDGLSDDADPDTELSTDPAHCGSCSRNCAGTIANATAACVAGACAIGSCDPGYFDKNGDPSDGCEERCQASCTFAFTSTTCDSTSCTFVGCLPGHLDLDGDTAPPPDHAATTPWAVPDGANGCEYACSPSNGGVEICDGEDNDCDGLVDGADPDVDTTSDTNNCGGCTTPEESFACSGIFAYGDASCVAGHCTLADCQPGHFDNDGNPENGCEFSCSSCQFPHASADAAHCAANAECRMAGCLSNYLDLDGEPSNGCEAYCTATNGGVEICDGVDNDCDGLVDDDDPDTNTETDTLNCGACGQSCGGQIPNASPSCVDGVCRVGSCLPGFYDVNGLSSDGCEASCASFCSFPFAATTCSGLSCSFQSCTPGYIDLNGDMTSASGNIAANADGCEYRCDVTEGGTELCDGLDNDCNGLTDDADPNVDVLDDASNCGACGNSCAVDVPNAVPTCSNGSCIITQCLPGYFDNDGILENGCEFACSSCRFEHASSNEAYCLENGACQFSACLDGYYNLTGGTADGCEYQCTPTEPADEVCDGLDNDCDGALDEADPDLDTDSDLLHCGGCTTAADNHSCLGLFANATPVCNAGSCEISECLEGYHDVDGDPENGCEFNCDECSFANANVDDEQCLIDLECVFDGCLDGFLDLDADLGNGCEYQCVVTNGGVEICDNLDNDCNGQVDEGIIDTPENCGACGLNCAPFFPGSATLCLDVDTDPLTPAECVWNGCLAGYADIDDVPANGCEYQCTPLNGGVEACNGLDDDCDGVVDDVAASELGDACSGHPELSEGECSATTVCADLGGGTYGPSCVQTVGPSTEVCDNLDNDCDGSTDEVVDGSGNPDPLPGTGIRCGSDRGECVSGLMACVDDGAGGKILDCVGATAPATETCDSLDNDCDGLVDEELGGGECYGGDHGLCRTSRSGEPVPAGLLQCDGTAMVCVGAVEPATEVCDTFDNNCDGVEDEGCWSCGAAFTRLDTGEGAVTDSAQGEDSTFDLAASSSGDLFHVAYVDRRDGYSRVYQRVSTNAGATWLAEVRVGGSSSSAPAVEPFVFGRSGRIYTTYSQFTADDVRRIYARYATSSNNYATVSSAIRVDDVSDVNYDAYGSRGIFAGQDGSANDYLAVVYTVVTNDAPTPGRSAYLAYSKNGGTSWLGRWQLYMGSPDPHYEESPVLGTDGNGMVYVAWRERTDSGDRVGFNRVDLSVASPALEAGAWISPLMTVADLQMASDEDGNLHVAWTDVGSTPNRIRVASASACQRAHDNAACLDSFSTVSAERNGIVVSRGAVPGDASSPHLAASNDAVAVVWEDSRSGALDIRANSAQLLAGTWTWLGEQPRVDVGDAAGSDASLEPKVAFGQGSTVLVTWTDQRDSTGAIGSIYTNVSYDGGATFFSGTGASALRVDGGFAITEGDCSIADSKTPFILPSSTGTAAASVIWVDYCDDTSPPTSGLNGDIWTRAIGDY